MVRDVILFCIMPIMLTVAVSRPYPEALGTASVLPVRRGEFLRECCLNAEIQMNMGRTGQFGSDRTANTGRP